MARRTNDDDIALAGGTSNDESQVLRSLNLFSQFSLFGTEKGEKKAGARKQCYLGSPINTLNQPYQRSLRPSEIDPGPGFTVSFSGEIPLLGGNGIPFRNFGEFRRISVDFGRNLLNFEFENEIFRKIPKFRIPVTSGNGKFSEISAKFRRNC